MLLTAQNLVPYLLDRGLVDPSSAIDGDLQVAESSRRHLSWKVLRRRGPGLFVKQARDANPVSTLTLEREAACYRLAAEERALVQLRSLIPGLRAYDAERHALVLDLVPEGETLNELHERHGGVPTEVAGELGRLLGRLQQETAGEPLRGRFPGAVPWVLQLPDLPLESFRDHGPAALQVVSRVRSEPTLCAALGGLRREFRCTTLMHGDLKWENCLATGVDGKTELRLIDWELADLGDPLWDAGAMLQAFLLAWIWSMPLDERLSAAELLARARYPLAAVWPPLRAFWDGYLTAREIAGDAAGPHLDLAAGFAAARLIQTAFELAAGEPDRVNHARCLLQASYCILTGRRDAIRDLFGLGARTS